MFLLSPLASGRTVRATANHPFLHRRRVAGGRGRLEAVGDGRVAVAVSVPEPAATRPWRPAAIVLLAHLLGNAGGSLRGSLQCRTADLRHG